jgi:hypothetical protein
MKVLLAFMLLGTVNAKDHLAIITKAEIADYNAATDMYYNAATDMYV